MVGFKNLAWLPEKPNHRRISESSNLGILAFETAKIMSRLISLYKSLSDEGISRLRDDVIRSKGVQFLNSMDEEYLLSLACGEKLEDLDRVASAVSCLGKKCNDFGLNRFDIVYTDLKLGLVDFGKLQSHGSDKKIRKMEKLVSTTSCLQAALEALTEMEVTERRLKLLTNRQIEMMKINLDDFNDKLEEQRKEVRFFRENSLWTETFDKSVDLMARIVCVVYLKICSVFGPQPQRMFQHDKAVSHSGPLLTKSKPIIVRFYSQRSIHFPDEDKTAKCSSSNAVFHSAGPETVGGSGLTMRYANLIILAEKYLDSKVSISANEREMFYQMVPENVQSVLRTKLGRKMRCAESDASLAEGWRDAMAEMMGWLAPMAHDSVEWQMERKLERTKVDESNKGSSVLLVQTLHFSDKEKTEAAIAEVLVGLSCIFRFENRQICV
ncbi:hypothetical protein CASFOL_031912 [Castilleja foliolosa]|uniref:DUF3475 domain-containing protein n=1 Tax=Castilleja foliolosa TaxID=1961234 RepID=A0ABD3BZC0_9LAMI